jgi:hypothetical protein
LREFCDIDKSYEYYSGVFGNKNYGEKIFVGGWLDLIIKWDLETLQNYEWRYIK